MSRGREVLPDRTEARQEHLRSSRHLKAAHAPLAFAHGLMTVLGAIVQARSLIDENVFHVREIRGSLP